MLECSHTQMQTGGRVMLFIQIGISLLALYIAHSLWTFVVLGRKASQSIQMAKMGLLLQKKELFSHTACLLGVLLLFIVCIDSAALANGHHRPELFNTHVAVSVGLLFCFLLMRIRTGERYARSHRVIGYVTISLFAYTLASGLWFLWKM